MMKRIVDMDLTGYKNTIWKEFTLLWISKQCEAALAHGNFPCIPREGSSSMDPYQVNRHRGVFEEPLASSSKIDTVVDSEENAEAPLPWRILPPRHQI